jgi:2-polyprenyl-3-methyl-5-hydroxy-6-metoxy-1,4-benzoquinol methylase
MKGPEINAKDYFTEEPKRIVTVSNPDRGGTSAPIYDFLDQSLHYSSSFGLQWKKYRAVQIDRVNRTTATFAHLKEGIAQNDLSVFDGATCLEIGSGAGRFTDYLVELCTTVITIEPSEALTVNAALGAPNLVAAHADLFQIPIRREKIDVVFCRGVTQHTRNTKASIRRLFDYVRPGGIVLFDVYPLRWYTPFVTKYWLRPFLRRMDPARFTKLAERWVPKLLKFKARYVTPLLPDNIWGRNIANQIVPIADFSQSPHFGDEQMRIQWSILDTVDMYTPRYDKPMTFRSILQTLDSLGARDVMANKTTFCFRAVAPG